ncbi:MAG: ABC transporter ATP-binding protein [Bacteroidetes bacterium]|uniref:ABC transporter ATP-binding protein n=1 Tax=Candidatus Cryptobacteroides intestinavium TaxID=2840766 RepID=A0A9D9ERC9_9BACT|nr:ABC transporter ATP-binding protein [Candidatus Cryptobacteroides intestinavium]
MREDNVIEVEHLTKKFGSFTAVDDISFEVHRGEIFGFLGANGAGKTTAMKMLTGLSFPTSGKGVVAGYDIWTQSELIKKSIGYMSQKFSLYSDLTVKDNIEIFGGIYGMKRNDVRKRAVELMDRLGFISEKNERVKDLPQGWKQKLAFLVAIIHRPEILFLDEPTGGVDPAARRQFWELIYDVVDSGITAFVTTHYMDEAEYCNRISMMVDGRIDALDSPSSLKKKYGAASIGEVFDILARGARRSE